MKNRTGMNQDKWKGRMRKRRDLIDKLFLETGLGSVEVVGLVNDIMENHLTYEEAVNIGKKMHMNLAV